MKFKIPYALQIIEQEKINEPNNVAWILLESYCGFLTIYAQEEYDLFEKFEESFGERIEKANQLANDDPWKRYIQSELILHKAYARAKFEEYISTIWELRKGFKLVEENAERFPNFQPNYKTLGFFHAVIGTIPKKFRFGMKLLGFHGQVEQGMQELKNYQTFAKQENTFFEEAQLMSIFFMVYLDKKPKQAWQIVQRELEPSQSLLHSFIYAEIAHKAGEGDLAIEAAENRPKGSDFLDYHFMDHYTGLLKMARLDEDAADHFQHFLNNYKGRHYIKEAWQRLALCNLMKGDTALYFEQLANCKTHGAMLMDQDRNAQKEAELKVLPNIHLLKARFLNDGGYNDRALDMLHTVDTSSLSKAHRLEWLYRIARVYEKQGKEEKAVTLYQKTYQSSPNNQWYFGAKACLQLGHLYANNLKWALAKTWYNRVAEFDEHPYTNSFEQQAKAGLSRVNNK